MIFYTKQSKKILYLFDLYIRTYGSAPDLFTIFTRKKRFWHNIQWIRLYTRNIQRKSISEKRVARSYLPRLVRFVFFREDETDLACSAMRISMAILSLSSASCLIILHLSQRKSTYPSLDCHLSPHLAWNSLFEQLPWHLTRGTYAPALPFIWQALCTHVICAVPGRLWSHCLSNPPDWCAPGSPIGV